MPPPDPARPTLWRQILLIAATDMRLEWRSREIIYTMVLFSALVVVVFSFAFAKEGVPASGLAGGILWVVVAFAGTLGLGRFFSREQEEGTSRAMLLVPGTRAAVYLGKLVGVLAYMVATEAVVMPLLLLLFGLSVSSWPLLVALLFAGSLGFAAVGSLLAAPLSQRRDVLLGVLLYPVVTPVIIAGARGTAALVAGPGEAASALVWLKLLAVFDVVFVVLALWVYEPLTRQE